jgi:hypothetical protein
VVRQLRMLHILALYCCEVLRGSAAALHTTVQSSDAVMRANQCARSAGKHVLVLRVAGNRYVCVRL